jgi:hypothetical protein
VGDSIHLRVTSAKDFSGKELVASASGATTFDRTKAASIAARTLDQGRTLSLVLVVAMAGVILSFALTYIALWRGAEF